MNTPLDRTLQALDEDGKVVWEADLEENASDVDPEAGKYSDAVPTFHGLSAAGNVTGKVGLDFHPHATLVISIRV